MPDTMIPAIPVTSAKMPVEIAAAVAKVMNEIKSLPKAARNEHGGYAFASIDAFLSNIGPLCASSGLLVIQDEESMETIDRAGKTWLRITYSFVLGHASGAMWERPMRRTVYQRIDGPQSTGGTQSYALKMFLRSIFMVPTGDDDPDFQPKESMQSSQKPQDAPKAPRRTDPPKAPSDPVGPTKITIPMGDDGLLIGRWTKQALETLAGRPEGWRRDWLEMHQDELTEVRKLKPEYADRIEGVAIAPDVPAQAAAE